MNQVVGKVLALFGVLLLVLLGMIGVWVLREGGSADLRQLVSTGEIHTLQPALFQTAPLRTGQGGTDRVYLVSTQSETITRFGSGRRNTNPVRRDLLHIDLWAVDAGTGVLAWRKRLRSFEGTERQGRDLRGFDLLGVDGKTLWLTLDGPLGVSLSDGSVVADGARIESRNPAMAGKRVNELGYVAFGKHGLQLTLNDASQWRIDASDLGAAPRDVPVANPQGIMPPAGYARGASSAFVTRAISIGEHWLGVLTDQEADHYRKPPVVPGRDPGDRPGAMQQYLEANHVPAALELRPQAYRLWRARAVQVSAAPPDWPRGFPDKWGKRPKFSDYAVLPEAPRFLRAGLLQEKGERDQALWYRNPDSVLVLHSSKLGQDGRLQLTRVSGPAGKPVWSVALPFDDLQSVMRGNNDLILLGSEPAPPRQPGSKTEDEGPHLKLVRLDVATGMKTQLDLTAESLKQYK